MLLSYFVGMNQFHKKVKAKLKWQKELLFDVSCLKANLRIIN